MMEKRYRTLFGRYAHIGKNPLLMAAFSFLLSNVTSLLVLSSYPFLQGNGDTSTYIILSREILNNGMLLPATNAIHYPGSVWVYPPVIPYLGAVLLYASGANGWATYRLFAIMGVELFSLTAIPSYYLVRNLEGEKAASIFALLYPFFLPSLYILSWGGYPQLAGFLLISIAFYFLSKAARQPDKWMGNASKAGISLFLLALTHDLSFIIILASLVFLLVIRVLLLMIGRNPGTNQIKTSALSLLFATLGGVIWYAPRAWWVIDAAFPASSAAYNTYAVGVPASPSLMAAIYLDLNGLEQPLGLLSQLLPVLAMYFALLICIMVTGAKFLHKDRAFDNIFSLLLVSVVMTIVELNDTVLFSRLAYFVFFASFLVLPSLLLSLFRHLQKDTPNADKKHLRSLRKLSMTALITVIILNSGVGIYGNYVSHSYFAATSSNEANVTSIDSVLGYMHTNITHIKSVAAPDPVSFCVGAYLDVPVLSYEPSNYLTQPVEWEENYVAYVLIYHSSSNLSTTLSYVKEYKVSYVIVPSDVGNVTTSFRLVWSTPAFDLYAT